MCQRRPGLSTASDSSPTSSDNSEQPQMDTHMIVDTVTLCVVVVLALLFLASRAWQKRKAALSVQSKGSQTDNPILNIDSTINSCRWRSPPSNSALSRSNKEGLKLSPTTGFFPCCPSPPTSKRRTAPSTRTTAPPSTRATAPGAAARTRTRLSDHNADDHNCQSNRH